MIAIGAVASENTNLVTGGAAASTGAIDFSFSPHGPSQADGAGAATMSFDDFLDMINPLQHIPVVSSIYRAVTGETINPVSRIAGDALYGGAMGVVSAGVSALGAIGDEVIAANNDGKTASETVMAALFGAEPGSNGQTTQLADAAAPETSAAAAPAAAAATATSNTIQLAGLQTPARQSPILQMPDLSAATAQTASNSSLATFGAPAPTESGANRGLPIDRSKLAYGGVMDSSMLQNAQQNQTLALAMAGQSGILKAQSALRSNRFATAGAASTPAASPATATAAPQVPAEPATQSAMQNLIQELQAMKAINQYKNAAQSTPIPGGTLDIAN